MLQNENIYIRLCAMDFFFSNIFVSSRKLERLDTRLNSNGIQIELKINAIVISPDRDHRRILAVFHPEIKWKIKHTFCYKC